MRVIVKRKVANSVCAYLCRDISSADQSRLVVSCHRAIGVFGLSDMTVNIKFFSVHFCHGRHIDRMNETADANRVISEKSLENFTRPHVRPRTTLLQSINDDLSFVV